VFTYSKRRRKKEREGQKVKKREIKIESMLWKEWFKSGKAREDPG
jgi:hypothetical protein